MRVQVGAGAQGSIGGLQHLSQHQSSQPHPPIHCSEECCLCRHSNQEVRPFGCTPAWVPAALPAGFLLYPLSTSAQPFGKEALCCIPISCQFQSPAMVLSASPASRPLVCFLSFLSSLSLSLPWNLHPDLSDSPSTPPRWRRWDPVWLDAAAILQLHASLPSAISPSLARYSPWHTHCEVSLPSVPPSTTPARLLQIAPRGEHFIGWSREHQRGQATSSRNSHSTEEDLRLMSVLRGAFTPSWNSAPTATPQLET